MFINNAGTSTDIRAGPLQNKLRTQVPPLGTSSQQVVFLVLKSKTHRTRVVPLSVRRAAASHRLRCLMLETQFEKGREAQRERGGDTQIHHLWHCDQFTWIFPSCDFVPQSPNSCKSSAIQYKRLFTKKKTSILLAKQSLRTSKMATRNTSSSDALLDRSPAHLSCDWTAPAAPALLFVKTP